MNFKSSKLRRKPNFKCTCRIWRTWSLITSPKSLIRIRGIRIKILGWAPDQAVTVTVIQIHNIFNIWLFFLWRQGTTGWIVLWEPLLSLLSGFLSLMWIRIQLRFWQWSRPATLLLFLRQGTTGWIVLWEPLLSLGKVQHSVVLMVSDGNSEHVAQASRKIGLFGENNPLYDLIKCLKQIKEQIAPYVRTIFWDTM